MADPAELPADDLPTVPLENWSVEDDMDSADWMNRPPPEYEDHLGPTPPPV